MSKMKALVCRECGKEYPTKAIHVCEMCFGPLEVKYNYDEIKKTISRKKIEDGPRSMWRYLDLLPVEGTNFVGPHAGFTPLEAIRSATAVPSEVMRLSNEAGTLEPGKRADLVVLDRDPLLDIHNIRTSRWVVANGRMFQTAELRKAVYPVTASPSSEPRP